MFETVSVIGGDLRQLTLAGLLKAEGYHVFLYGFDKDETILDGLHNEDDIDYVLGTDIIILPVPVTFDGAVVNSPYSNKPLGVEELLDNVNQSAIVFGGQIKPNLQCAFEERGIAYRDYLKREELAIRNAIPTVLAVEVRIWHILKYEETCRFLISVYHFAISLRCSISFLTSSASSVVRRLKHCRHILSISSNESTSPRMDWIL